MNGWTEREGERAEEGDRASGREKEMEGEREGEGESEGERERVRDVTLFHTHALVEARISVPPPFERERCCCQHGRHPHGGLQGYLAYKKMHPPPP